MARIKVRVHLQVNKNEGLVFHLQEFGQLREGSRITGIDYYSTVKIYDITEPLGSIDVCQEFKISEEKKRKYTWVGTNFGSHPEGVVFSFRMPLIPGSIEDIFDYDRKKYELDFRCGSVVENKRNPDINNYHRYVNCFWDKEILGDMEYIEFDNCSFRYNFSASNVRYCKFKSCGLLNILSSRVAYSEFYECYIGEIQSMSFLDRSIEDYNSFGNYNLFVRVKVGRILGLISLCKNLMGIVVDEVIIYPLETDKFIERVKEAYLEGRHYWEDWKNILPPQREVRKEVEKYLRFQIMKDKGHDRMFSLCEGSQLGDDSVFSIQSKQIIAAHIPRKKKAHENV